MPLRIRRAGRQEAAPTGEPATPDPPDDQWWHDHYEWAVGEVLDFVAGGGATLAGATVADVGCGDGIIDLGLAVRAQPARLVGYDVNPTDTTSLLARSRRNGGPGELPENLEFAPTESRRIPAGDATYDAVVTWSAFEHVRDPVAVLAEVRRVLKPSGFLFLQLWPFYHSERGSHLWDWFPEGFHHLDQSEEEIAEAMRASDRQERVEYMLGEYRTLNRIDLDGLQRALLAGGFGVTQLELVSHRVMIPPRLMRYPLSQLGIGGVKLLAAPL